jgi:hypothetical protein
MQNVQSRARSVLFVKSFLSVLILATCLYLMWLVSLPRNPFRVPVWLAQRAERRVGLLHPGMSEAQVWSTLGLSGWGLNAHVSGSGPSSAFPANYRLWPGYVLHTRWNYRTQPVTLVEAEFRQRL